MRRYGTKEKFENYLNNGVKKEKHMKEKLTLTVLLGIIYVILSFVELDINLFEWSKAARIIFAIIVIILVLLEYMVIRVTPVMNNEIKPFEITKDQDE